MADKRNKYDIASTITDDKLYSKNVYLIGTAELGPTNTPMRIVGVSQAEQLFGTKGTLIQGFKEIKEVSPDSNIFLMKTTGTHSLAHLNVNVKGGDIIEDGFIIKSKDSNQIYNNVKIIINAYSIIFQFPTELGGGFKEYVYSDYEILGLLARQINEDTRVGNNFLYAQCMVDQNTPIFGAISPVNPVEMYMYGGNDGLIYYKNQYYYCLNETYKLLEGEPVDIIVPLEAFIDDVHPQSVTYGSEEYNSLFYQEDKDYLSIRKDNKVLSYYEQLLLFCVKQLRFGFVTHGVMGFNKTYNKSLYGNVENYFLDVVKAGLEANKTRADLVDFYSLISIVVGDLYSDYGSYVNNGYTLYAGLISNMAIVTNPTNKSFGQSISLFNEFSETDIDTLSNLGCVTFRMSPLYNTVVVTTGVTSAPTTTDLHYLCNVRMIQNTISFVKEQLEVFIGEDINMLIKGNLIDTNLNNLLNFLKERGVLSDFKQQVIVNDEVGSITVYVDLKTIYMVDFIRAIGSLNYQVE